MLSSKRNSIAPHSLYHPSDILTIAITQHPYQQTGDDSIVLLCTTNKPFLFLIKGARFVIDVRKCTLIFAKRFCVTSTANLPPQFFFLLGFHITPASCNTRSRANGDTGRNHEIEEEEAKGKGEGKFRIAGRCPMNPIFYWNGRMCLSRVVAPLQVT